MLSYLDLTKRFGSCLFDDAFEAFLRDTFTDLTIYDVSKSPYITSESTAIELGFVNEDAVFDEDDEIVFEKGHPLFSHLNIYPKSITLISELPFELTFADNRNSAFIKAGKPTQTKEGDFLGNPFLIDHYKIGNTVVSIDYYVNDLSIKTIQVRGNNLLRHLKL